MTAHDKALPDDPKNLDLETWNAVKLSLFDAKTEINRLEGLLNHNGIPPQSEFICKCGIRRGPRQKGDPPF